MVIQTKNGDNLWQARHMHSICRLEDKYISPSWSGCPAHTLPYLIGALQDKSCSDIQQTDMDSVFELLSNCSEYYHQGLLTDDCYHSNDTDATAATRCQGVPQQCTQYNAVYYILHYFTDVNFLRDADPANDFLRYSMIIYRRSWDYDEDSLFKHFLKHLEGYRINVHSGGVEMKAMDFYLIFNRVNRYYVLIDLPFYMLAMILVVIVLLAYLRSPLLMLAVMVNVGLSVVTAYFLYHVVFQFKFFTFINLLACLLLIAVGADDVFILHDIWQKARTEVKAKDDDGGQSIELLTSVTLRHGVLSILVTSLTTAAALFSNAVSGVTALKCFGIFGGLCILVNFYYMITLVPAVLVISERYQRRHPNSCSNRFCDALIERVTSLWQKLWFRVMPKLILKPWLLWLVVFTAVALGGMVVIFYEPALQLPSARFIDVSSKS